MKEIGKGQTAATGALLTPKLRIWLLRGTAFARRAPAAALRFLKRNAVSLVSLPMLAWLLTLLWRERADVHLATFGDSHLLQLLGAILVLAAALQGGDHLLNRLKKAGPLEFAEREARATLPKLDDLVAGLPHESNRLVVSDPPSALTLEEKHSFDKADSLVRYLEWSHADLKESSELLFLISRVGLIALDQGNHVLAIDRFNYLMRVSEGTYKPFEIRRRLALANCLFGVQLLEQPRSEPRAKELLARAIHETWEADAARTSRDSEWLYSVLYIRGQAYDFLEKQSDALHWYTAAMEANPSYAPAIFNRASILAKQGDLEGSLRLLDSLRPDHEEVANVRQALEAPNELVELRADPTHRQAIARIQTRLG